MKLKSILAVLVAALCFAACDDDTSYLGTTLTNNMDHLQISTDTFTINTRSILAGSVLSKSATSYLGTMCDPETGDYVTADYMTQFHMLENPTEDQEFFPALDSIGSFDANGEVIADSCELRLFFDSYYGDSLTAMKLTAYELDINKQMSEMDTYLSDFDPMKEGYVRTDGLKASKSYSLIDMNVARSTREGDSYSKNIRVMLNKPYTDNDGVTYNNYGTYVLRTYYKHPEYFNNSVALAKHVIPGFYIKSTGGIGSIAKIYDTRLNIYLRYHNISEDTDTIYAVSTNLDGTEEVLQQTQYNTDNTRLKEMVEDNTCTYLKTPAGIFTEVEFPVDDICKGHDNDTINSAKFVLQRMLNNVHTDYTLDIPETVMILPEDSLQSFFANDDITNYRTSYLGTYSSTDNTYTFNNVGALIKAMQQAKKNGETSEKVYKAVILPVATSTNSSGYISKVTHEMGLTSTKLVGGSDNPHDAIKLSVIYSKYK